MLVSGVVYHVFRRVKWIRKWYGYIWGLYGNSSQGHTG